MVYQIFRFSLVQDGSSTNPDHYIYATFKDHTTSIIPSHLQFQQYFFKDIGATELTCPMDDPIDVII